MGNRRFRLEIPADNNGIAYGEITQGLISTGIRIEKGIAAMAGGKVRASGPEGEARIIGTYGFVEDGPDTNEGNWNRLKVLVRQMSDWANDDDMSERYNTAKDVLSLMKMLEEPK